jgi:hypothetical protein
VLHVEEVKLDSPRMHHAQWHIVTQHMTKLMSHADRVPDGFAARGTDACSKITSHAERCEARDGFGGRTRNWCGARRMARVQNSFFFFESKQVIH